MIPTIAVKEAKYLDHFKIYLKFKDGKEGIIDLESKVKTDPRDIFRELEDVESFRKFHVAYNTLIWENGLDLAPEFLYEKLQS